MASPSSYVHRPICLCSKPISNNEHKCTKCGWHFCSVQCKSDLLHHHSKLCGPDNAITQFMSTNQQFFQCWGTWLRLAPNSDTIGVVIELNEKGKEIVAVSPINDVQYRGISKDVHGAPIMRKLGYPYVFFVFVAWKKLMFCHEVDIAVDGALRLLCNESTFFTDAKNSIVPSYYARKGYTQSQWYLKHNFCAIPVIRPQLIPLPHRNFDDWVQKQRKAKINIEEIEQRKKTI